MRPQPLTAANGLFPGVLGVSVVRGDALPVLSLGELLHQPDEAITRFVVVRTPGRDFVIACAAVEYIGSFDESEWERLPSLLQSISAAERIAAVDRDLVVTLDMGRVLETLPPQEGVTA
jgi:chemotaxis signal transduction protein